MKGFPLLGALEGHMFPEMGQPLLLLVLISTADVENKAAVHQSGVWDFLVDDTDAIRKVFVIQLHRKGYLFWNVHKRGENSSLEN